MREPDRNLVTIEEIAKRIIRDTREYPPGVAVDAMLIAMVTMIVASMGHAPEECMEYARGRAAALLTGVGREVQPKAPGLPQGQVADRV